MNKQTVAALAAATVLCMQPAARADDAKAQAVPDFMKIVVANDPDEIPTKDQLAFSNVYDLNEGMFPIYEKRIALYRKHFLARQNLIMALFSAKGGRFILYRAGKPPLEAPSPPQVYRLAKSVGHCAMVTEDLCGPYTTNSATNQEWVSEMTAYRTRVQTALDSLDGCDISTDDRELLRDTLKQIAAFQDKCLKNKSFTYDDVQTYARTIEPNLEKLIGVASSNQVAHWFKVMEEWKALLGKDWDNTYALSNSIYVARQNNILFSVLLQFMGPSAVNDRLILMETTDFTATPETMMDGFIRIISDRALGKVFFDNYRLMDYELLGGGGRKAIIAEMEKRGLKANLPPLVPFNSTEIPWKDNPASGTGPSSLDEIKAGVK